MGEITLYRKHRPKTWSQVVGQSHIKKTLQNELRRGQITHAYIFSGPRGVGKTTMARLLSKSVNCLNFKNGEPCNKCDNCKAVNESRFLDLIEIDAASHTGVDDVRELIERIKLAPTIGKYKIYIIDETHMLSRSAFNALLKTLEEPPTHAIFILATTEIFRVPETIISRCERFDFQKLNTKEIEERLKAICRKEKIYSSTKKTGAGIKIENEALSLIARAARGAIRDAESLLAQIISFGNKRIKQEEVKTFLGITDKKAIIDFTDAISKKDSKKAVSIINELSASGYDLEEFTKEFIEHQRELLLIKIDNDLIQFASSILSDEDRENLISQSKNFSLSYLLKSLKLFIIAQNEIKNAVYPELPLEMAVIELCGERKDEGNNKNRHSERPRKTESLPGKAEKSLVSSKSGKKHLEQIKQSWNKIIYRIRDKNASLAAFLKSAKPAAIEKNTLLLFVPFDFYKERLLALENRLLVEKTISKILDQKILLNAKTEAEFIRFNLEMPEDKDEEEKTDKIVSDAIEVLGGEIVD